MSGLVSSLVVRKRVDKGGLAFGLLLVCDIVGFDLLI